MLQYTMLTIHRGRRKKKRVNVRIGVLGYRNRNLRIYPNDTLQKAVSEFQKLLGETSPTFYGEVGSSTMLPETQHHTSDWMDVSN